MSDPQIDKKELFEKCLDFHGHLCPGLTMGFQAATAGMECLSEARSQDEEIVAIVETDACCCDAIQVITGCTFGKGNFIYKDYGKTAFTFFSRNSGKGVRIAKKQDPAPLLSPRHQELIDLIRQGKASDAEREEFKKIHETKAMEILEKDPEDIFTISKVTIPTPPKAKIEPSVLCDVCKEPTMASKLVLTDGRSVCRGCMAEKKGA